MGAKRLSELTELQVEILSVFWKRGEATAAAVHEALAARTGLGRKTFGTLLSRLESYGVLAHREEGRTFVYRALVAPEEVREAKAKSLLAEVFDGSVSEFVNYALEAGEVRPGDVERIRTLIEEWEKARKPGEGER